MSASLQFQLRAGAETQALLSLPFHQREYRENADIVRQGDRPTQCCLVMEGMLCPLSASSRARHGGPIAERVCRERAVCPGRDCSQQCQDRLHKSAADRVPWAGAVEPISTKSGSGKGPEPQSVRG